MKRGAEGGREFKRFAKNTGWLVAQNVFQYVLSAVIGILAARYMGPSNYGVLGFGASLMAMFLPLCTLGLDSVQIPAMIAEPERTGEFIGTSLALRGASSALSIMAIAALTALLKPNNPLMLLVTVLQSLQLLLQMFDSFRLWFQMNLLSKYTAIGSVIGNTACSVWRIVLLMRGASVEYFALTSVIQMLTNYFFVIPMFFYRAKLKLSVSLDAAKLLLSKGYHFILSGLTVAITNYYGKVLLGYQLGEAPLGLYNAASSVALMWIFVPQAIVDSAMPVLLKTKREQPLCFTERLQTVYLAVTLIGVLAGLGLTVLSRFVIDFLYGEAFLGAASLLRILAWTGLLSSIGVARGIWVLAEEKHRYVKYYCGIGAASSVILSSVGVWLYGAPGAAVAAVVTGVVQALIAPLFFKETRCFTMDFLGSFRRAPELMTMLKRRIKNGEGNNPSKTDEE